MLIKTKAKAVELVIKSIPYPDQIIDWDLVCSDEAIYFTWRSGRYRLGLTYCSIEQKHGCILTGNDTSILMEHCLKAKIGTIL